MSVRKFGTKISDKPLASSQKRWYFELSHVRIIFSTLIRGERGTRRKIGWDEAVRFASQNPYPIYDQNLRFSLLYLWPDQKLDMLFMTVAAGTVALNISYEGLFCRWSHLGLATSCSRFPKKFPEISQKVARKLRQKKSKVAFYNESCSKVAKKSKNLFCFSLLLFGLM